MDRRGVDRRTLDRRSPAHFARPRAWLTVALAVLACGCNPDPPKPPPPTTEPAAPPIEATIERLIDMLYVRERPNAEKAKVQLIGLRGKVTEQHLEDGFARGIAADRYGELVKLIIEIGQRPQEREKMSDLLKKFLEREITPEKLTQFQRLPPAQPTPQNDEEKNRLKEERGQFLQAQTKIGRMMATLAAGLLELEAEAKIPVNIRVVYFTSVLGEMAQSGKDAYSITACEAAANLLAIGPEALGTIASQINSSDDNVSRRFFGIALWLWRPALVAKILAEIERNGPRNMQVYALLGHLTMRPLTIADVGFTPPSQEEFVNRRAELLALWHPKLLANWKDWYAAHGAETMDQWWKDGFKRAGIEVSSVRDRAAIPALIEAVLQDDYIVHVAALHLLQRLTYRDARQLTYLEITEYNLDRVIDTAYPDDKTRPKLTPPEIRKLVHADWKAWLAAHADRPWSQWAREDADYAVATLQRLSDLAKLKSTEQTVGYTMTNYLRLLSRQPQTGVPGVPSLSWADELTAARNRSRLIHHFKTLVDKIFASPEFGDRIAGWWPF